MDTAVQETVIPFPEAMLAKKVALPRERSALTHRFNIAGYEGYITVGMYEDGRPGEVFISVAKEGSTISGLMDSISILTSVALQHCIPLKTLIDKMAFTRFEPSGITNNEEIPMAQSIVDYVFRWLDHKFMDGNITKEGSPKRMTNGHKKEVASDAPICRTCGTVMVRNGSCHKCDNCGGTSGCS